MNKMKTMLMGGAIGIILLCIVILIGEGVRISVKDYSHEYMVAKIYNTYGYVLYEDRESYFFSGLNRRREIELLYVDSIGVWHREKFPMRLVEPVQPIQTFKVRP